MVLQKLTQVQELIKACAKDSKKFEQARELWHRSTPELLATIAYDCTVHVADIDKAFDEILAIRMTENSDNSIQLIAKTLLEEMVALSSAFKLYSSWASGMLEEVPK